MAHREVTRTIMPAGRHITYTWGLEGATALSEWEGNVSDMFLSAEELQELTRRVQRAAQVKVLRFMGIEHRLRPDGTVAVLRAHVEKVFGAAPAAARKTTPKEPDWEARAELERTRAAARGKRKG